jgi:hypothetical protein
MSFRKTALDAENKQRLQQSLNSGLMPFPLAAIPDEWWADADRDAALWATPAEGTAPLDFLWHYYLSIHGEYYRFLLQPEPLPSARITLYKLKEIVPSDRHGTPRETVIATLKAALISKTASGEHEAFFNF